VAEMMTGARAAEKTHERSQIPFFFCFKRGKSQIKKTILYEATKKKCVPKQKTKQIQSID